MPQPPSSSQNATLARWETRRVWAVLAEHRRELQLHLLDQNCPEFLDVLSWLLFLLTELVWVGTLAVELESFARP